MVFSGAEICFIVIMGFLGQVQKASDMEDVSLKDELPSSNGHISNISMKDAVKRPASASDIKSSQNKKLRKKSKEKKGYNE